MPRANLRLEIPEGVWIGEVTRANPDVLVRVLAALPDDEIGVGLAEIEGGDVPRVLESIADADDVVALEVLQQGDSSALVRFETTAPTLLLPARAAGVPLETPFEIRAGEVRWEVTAPQARLSELGERLENLGISFTVDRITQDVTDEQLLTDRQQRLLQTAVDRGYYDTPRGASLTAIAEAEGIAKSTASEVLHRAEEAVVKDFVARLRSIAGDE